MGAEEIRSNEPVIRQLIQDDRDRAQSEQVWLEDVEAGRARIVINGVDEPAEVTVARSRTSIEQAKAHAARLNDLLYNAGLDPEPLPGWNPPEA